MKVLSEPRKTIIHNHAAKTREYRHEIGATRVTVETCECGAQRSVYTVPAAQAKALYGANCLSAAVFSEWVKLSPYQWRTA